MSPLSIKDALLELYIAKHEVYWSIGGIVSRTSWPLFTILRIVACDIFIMPRYRLFHCGHLTLTWFDGHTTAIGHIVGTSHQFGGFRAGLRGSCISCPYWTSATNVAGSDPFPSASCRAIYSLQNHESYNVSVMINGTSERNAQVFTLQLSHAYANTHKARNPCMWSHL